MIVNDALESLKRQQAQALSNARQVRQTEAAKATARAEIIEFADGGAWVQLLEGSKASVFVGLESTHALWARAGNTAGAIVTVTGGAATA